MLLGVFLCRTRTNSMAIFSVVYHIALSQATQRLQCPVATVRASTKGTIYGRERDRQSPVAVSATSVVDKISYRAPVDSDTRRELSGCALSFGPRPAAGVMRLNGPPLQAHIQQQQQPAHSILPRGQCVAHIRGNAERHGFDKQIASSSSHPGRCGPSLAQPSRQDRERTEDVEMPASRDGH